MNARKVLQMPNAFAIAALAMASLLPHSYAMPNHKLTPGATFPTATRAQICVLGYSRGVRAPFDAAWRRKVAAVRRSYGVRGAGYTADHAISLELGGNNAQSNIWPEPTRESKIKDGVENRLHVAVCSGKMTLREAQLEISRDWTKTKVGMP